MITSYRPELPSKITAYYATWTRLGLSATTSPAASRLRESEMLDPWSARATLLCCLPIDSQPRAAAHLQNHHNSEFGSESSGT
jgi:hypothetical protein